MEDRKVGIHSTTVTIRLPKSLLASIPVEAGKPGMESGRSKYIRGLIVKSLEASNASNAASAAHQGL